MALNNLERPFFVDSKQPGIVRGGFFDELGGILCGARAQWICDALNAARLKELAEAATKPKGRR